MTKLEEMNTELNTELKKYGLTTEIIVDAIREISTRRPSNDFNELKKIVENAEISYVCFLLVAAARKGIIRDVRFLTSVAVKNNCWTEINDALCEAASAAQLDIVKVLVESGADVHYARDNALRLAVVGGYGDVVTYLLDNGADVNVLGGILVSDCCKNGDNDDVLDKLIQAGVDVIPHYHEALNICYEKKHDKCAQSLICWSSKYGFPPKAPPTPGTVEFDNVLNLRQSEDLNQMDSSETDSDN